MSFQKFEELVLPCGVHAGLSWLLAQDEEFRQAFAQDLLNTSKCMETKAHLDGFVGQENLMDFEDRLSYYIEGRKIFTHDLYSIYPDRIEVHLTEKLASFGDEYVITWLARAGRFKQNFTTTLDKIASMDFLTRKMVKETESWFKSNILTNWIETLKLGQALDRGTIKDLREYSVLYETTMLTDDGIIIILEPYIFIAECQNGVWIRTDKNSKTYKRYKLAQDLTE